MNIDTAFKSKFLRAVDLEVDTILTIKSIVVETVGQGKDAEEKPVIYFKEDERGLALNVTNKNTIKQLYGTETNDWLGKRITLYPTEVEFAGEMKAAIRVRTKAPAGKPGKAADDSAPPSELPEPNTKERARMQAWNAFLAKWGVWAKENPKESNVKTRNLKWNAAQAEAAAEVGKPASEFDEADWKLTAAAIEGEFDMNMASFLKF